MLTTNTGSFDVLGVADDWRVFAPLEFDAIVIYDTLALHESL